MKFLNELKNRFLLIILNCSLTFIISYYYKNILLFFLIKQIAINQCVSFYLIYTDISELLNTYVSLIYLLTNYFNSYFLIYHILTFINNALYKNEYKLLTLLFFSFLYINLIFSIFVIIKLYPIFWEFLQYFQKMFVFNLLSFEIKINEYYKTLLHIYTFFIYFVLIFLFNIIILNKYKKALILIKFRKISYVFLLFLFNIINDIFTQSIFFIFFLFIYESFICILIFTKHYKQDKIGLEPIKL